MSALDAQYQAKIMAEVERYQALVQEKEMLAERCGGTVHMHAWARMSSRLLG